MVRPSGICVLTDNLLMFLAESGLTPVDLSNATRLKDTTFRIKSPGPGWVTRALRTITPKHQDLRRISIYPDYFPIFIKYGYTIKAFAEQAVGRWLELDHVLTQLLESRSTPPRVMCHVLSFQEKAVRDLMGGLLPGVTGEGTVNLYGAW